MYPLKKKVSLLCHRGLRIHLKVIRLQCGVRSRDYCSTEDESEVLHLVSNPGRGWECGIEPALGRNQDFVEA